MSLRIICKRCEKQTQPVPTQGPALGWTYELEPGWRALEVRAESVEHQFYTCNDACAEGVSELPVLMEPSRDIGGLRVRCDQCRDESPARWTAVWKNDQETRQVKLPDGWKAVYVRSIKGKASTEVEREFHLCPKEDCWKQFKLLHLRGL